MYEDARAWIEMPPGTGWGTISLRKGDLGRDGYHAGEYRGTGLVMLSVRAVPGEYPGSPPGSSPWYRQPLLEPASPGSLLPDTVIGPLDMAAVAERRDGSWVRVRAVAEVRDRQGRWCVHLEWTDKTSGEERSGAYVYDPVHVRRGLCAGAQSYANCRRVPVADGRGHAVPEPVPVHGG